MEHLQPNADSKEGRHLAELLEENEKCGLETAPGASSGTLLCVVHLARAVPAQNKHVALALEHFFVTQNLAGWPGSWHPLIQG